MVMQTEKPEELEAHARVLETRADDDSKRGLSLSASTNRARAAELRDRAAALRKRRTDGVHFG